ncbi:conjugal transfer protein [Lactococcus ileimucosae]|uniref:conjugal transfer protein n=1 Tax=Lactococcus ileimucosae TaxID=2941329 RepID=UPI00351774A6
MKKQERLHYDYAIGLEMPYWIQEIRLRGKVYWTFQTPLSVSFLVVMGLSALVIFLLIRPLFPFLRYVPFIPVSLFTVVPWFIGKTYVEKEPDGKKVHTFLFGTLRFVKNFAFDKRCIYGEERREEVQEKIVFEKVML